MLMAWQASTVRADLADWVGAAAYLLAALLAAKAVQYAGLRGEERESLFWRFTAMLLVLLALNELLDLHTVLTAVGRKLAKSGGWYENHRRVQFIFVVALAGTTMFAVIAMLRFARRLHAAVRLGLAGLVFIVAYGLVRAASFHPVDDFLGRGTRGFNFGSLLEMAGISIVAAAATLYTRRPR